MTLIGIESLLSLREACTDAGLTRGDLDDIFLQQRAAHARASSVETPAADARPDTDLSCGSVRAP